MRSKGLQIFLGIIILGVLNSCQRDRASFTFSYTGQGIELSEGGAPVFFYQREPKSLDGTYVCNNYIHPLYSPAGDILTEEFPAGHPYHRGVFWAWMDFSGSFGENSGKSGLAILCHPSTPNYPASWILRQRSSMQNIVFPGRDRVELPVNQPVVLRYRTVLYAGNGSDINFDQLQAEYDQFIYPNSGPHIRN